jgi:hypothetical protein
VPKGLAGNNHIRAGSESAGRIAAIGRVMIRNSAQFESPAKRLAKRSGLRPSGGDPRARV